MSYYEFCFEALIEKLPIGNGPKVLRYNVVILPDKFTEILPFNEYPKLRIIGEIGDHPIRGAWNPVADGRKYFILSQKFLDNAELMVGDVTEVRFNIDDQDYVNIPIELQHTLMVNPTLKAKWDSLTAGKKRFHCHHVSSAKQQKTRDKRLADVISQLGC